MKVFTFISVSFLPQTVLGSLMGMNVPVPFQTSEGDTNLLPWFGVVGISIFFTLLAFGYFRHVKYI
jgi:Mg2+ and Co2+ transporter CorA